MNKILCCFVLFLFLVLKITAQNGIEGSIGLAVYEPVHVESNQKTSIVDPRIFPSPFFEIGYVSQLDDKSNLRASAAIIQYISHYGYHSDNEILNGGNSMDEFTSYKIDLVWERLLLPVENSLLFYYFGFEVQTQKVNRGRSIHGIGDSLYFTSTRSGEDFGVHPGLRAGVVYEIPNNRRNFWRIGLGLSYVFAKSIGESRFMVNTSLPEEGKLGYQGSNCTLKIGYLFSNNKN